MAQATFRSGEPQMVDYTPAAGNISAGDVILIGNTTGLCCAVAHRDIANNTLGAVAAYGGIYDVINLNNAAVGAKVYWDNTNDKATTTSTSNALFGFIVSGGGGGVNTTAQALHFPFV